MKRILALAAMLLAGSSTALAQLSVTLYEHENYRGRAQTFGSGEVANLRTTEIGNDSTSSVRVSPGCSVVLYADAGFRGRATELRGDEPDLRRTEVGSNNASSLRVQCVEAPPFVPEREPTTARGATLYRGP